MLFMKREDMVNTSSDHFIIVLHTICKKDGKVELIPTMCINNGDNLTLWLLTMTKVDKSIHYSSK